MIIHVADGWVARNIRQLDLRESEEMKQDVAYIAYIERLANAVRRRSTVPVLLVGGMPRGEPPA